MDNKEPVKITYVDFHECDLRFTGWEHECIIIDRTQNHYLVPEQRYNEYMEEKNKPITPPEPKPYNPNEGVSGSAGCYGSVGKSNSI